MKNIWNKAKSFLKAKIKYLIWLCVLVGLVVAGCITYTESGDMVTTAVTGYIALLGVFTGLEILDMIRKSLKKPKGSYQAVKKIRYLYAIVSIGALYIVLRHNPSAESLTMAKTLLIAGFFGMLTFLAGALTGNKIAADVDGGGGQCVET